MDSGNIVRGRSTTRTVLALLLVIGGTSNIPFPGCHAVSTINDVPNQSVTRGSPAEFSWNVALDTGITIVTAQWVKMPSTQLAVRSGTFTVSSLYTGRVTNPSAEKIILQNVNDSDAGTYQCTVTLSDLTTVEDSADLEVVDPTTPVPTTAAMTTNKLSTTTPDPGLSTGAVVGIAVGATAGGVIVIIVIVFIWKKTNARVSQDLSETGKKSTAEKDKTPKAAEETV